MLEQAQRDLTLTQGGNFDQAFVLFLDQRVKQWRGEWHEFFVYDAGEAVELEPGEAFVARMRTMDAKPGGPSSEEFWAPLEPMDLTDCHVELICGDVFTLTEDAGITVTPKLGKIEIEVRPDQTTAAPTSAAYYIKLTDVAGGITFPIRGTMLFKQP